MTAWDVEQISEVFDKAETEGPQLVELQNKRFILLTEEEWTARNPTPKQNPADAMMGAEFWEALRPPLESQFDFEFERPRWKPREIEL